MARFFIDRPIFAVVIAIIIMLAGVGSILNLPISQYPPVAPPSVMITATYPGASAQTIQDSVTQVIEQKMTGLDHLLYMSSNSDATGRMEMTLTFSSEANPDIAQVQVQNKLQLATPLLPEQVQRQGISVAKAANVFLKIYSFVDDNGILDAKDLSDFVQADILDSVSRLSGVGEANLFGTQYGMRIWMDPHKLRNYKLMPSDILRAITAENAQISAGQLGADPAMPGHKLNLSIALQERLNTPEQFQDIILRTHSDGSLITIGDVARVELGSENYGITGRYLMQASAGFAIKLTTGANALNTVDGVDAYLERVKPFFPKGVRMDSAYDSTPFVKISIHEVVKTLVEAVILVTLIMFLFLQNLRATFIPTIAVPVVLLGVFGVLAAFGYSINTLTMFAMVLAIGLLVDDAIVVVENVERVMYEEKLPPKEATKKSMDQITGALVGVATVLAAVFIPMAFLGGSAGVIYRQFSITIVSAMSLSVLIALILTPALCATMLKSEDAGKRATQGFFSWFNRSFNTITNHYQSGVAYVIHRAGRCMIIYVLLLGGVFWLFKSLPTGFLPEEDQGMMMVQLQLPAGSTVEQTSDMMHEIETYFKEQEKDTVEAFQAVMGFSFAGRGENSGTMFIRLKDWEERRGASQSVFDVVSRATAHFSQMPGARIYAMAPPAITELGIANGFDFELQDHAGLGHDALLNARNQLLGMAAQSPLLMAVRPNGLEDQPQMRVVIDRKKAGALGLSLSEVNTALSAIWGSAYTDDFLDRGRVKKVFIQGDASARMIPEDMDKWYFRNNKGEMTPFSSFATLTWEYSPKKLERYNGLPAFEILGMPTPGHSTGEAMLEIERLSKKLPAGIGYEWTGISYQERMSGSQAPLLYSLSILVVFLCLAALYESWSIPFSVILVIPLGVFGALAACHLREFSNDIYFQVGLLATIGLSAKNAILIIEFAKDLHDQGQSIVEAALHAARMRLRPILMTSLAFLLGILPLAISNGAGSGGQNDLGTGVIGGTFVATFLGIFAIPLFYVVIVKIFSFASGKHKERVHE